MATKEKVIELTPIDVRTATFVIEGDSDLVLNKMSARSAREMTDARKGKDKVMQDPNVWEDIITSIHWKDGIPVQDTYKECDEELLHQLLSNNKPCITAFGLKKSLNQAVVRNEIDKYSTKFDNAVNVIADKGLIPITFTEHFVDERLMSPQRGSPILARINHFCNWRAEFTIGYTTNVYSLEQIANIIKLAGFGLGIGSGRTSGYGRYHIIGMK